MSVNAVAHLNFHGQARQALEFYQSVFGGQATIATYGDVGLPPELPDADKVVFGQLTADNGFRIAAYDAPSQSPAAAAPTATTRENGLTLTGERFFVAVGGQTTEEVGALWDELADGAEIVEKYGPSPFSPGFGMLTDRFGVTWILQADAPHAG